MSQSRTLGAPRSVVECKRHQLRMLQHAHHRLHAQVPLSTSAAHIQRSGPGTYVQQKSTMLHVGCASKRL